jgi:hypothetical protein
MDEGLLGEPAETERLEYGITGTGQPRPVGRSAPQSLNGHALVRSPAQASGARSTRLNQARNDTITDSKAGRFGT